MSLSAVKTAVGARVGAERPQPGRDFDSLDFRRAMGRFPTGVTVVTMLSQGGQAYGITVNAFMSVSLEPPLIAVSLDRSARAYATMMSSERFAVSVLAEDQRSVSDRFAGRRVPHEPQPFDELDGFPVVAGAVAHIVCGMHSRFDAGDHTIFIGLVQALQTGPGEPLVFERGRYTRLEDGTAKPH